MGKIEIIYENYDFFVINKPAGLAVHNGAVNLVDTLEYELNFRLKPVHRLDRETSGLIVLARNKEVAARLQNSLQISSSHKEYLAIVKGRPSHLSGQWTRSLSPKAEGRKNPAGKVKDRVSALTHFEVIDQTPWLSLLRCHLSTGRQHQIRKHCSLDGCPVIGDVRYGNPKYVRMISKRYHFDGLALHAHCLSLTDHDQVHTFQVSPPKPWQVFDFKALG